MGPNEFAEDGWAALRRSIELARAGGVLTPAHLLVGITQTASFAAPPMTDELLRTPGQGPDQEADDSGGTFTDLLAGQVMGTAHDFARRRGEPIGAAHLLVAVLDQASPAVSTLLHRANADPAELRARALAALGASVAEPPLPLAALPPAGTTNRPPLPVQQLPADAWQQLVGRQQRLPLRRLRTSTDWFAISLNEQRAELRLADRLDLDDDQRYSLLHLHHREVQRRANEANPTVVQAPADRATRPVMRAGWTPGRRVRRRIPIGWRTWINNRRVDVAVRWTRQQ